jgi:hypothetical protein
MKSLRLEAPSPSRSFQQDEEPHGLANVLAGFAWTTHPSLNVKLIWIFLLIPFQVTVAWLVLKYFDEPVRAWLTRRYVIKPTTVLPDQSGATR